MMKNIPIGIYYPGDGVLYRLQARTKLLIVLWIAIWIVIANQRIWHFMPYVAVYLLLFVSIGLAGISPREMWRRLWLIVAVTLFSALFALFAGQGSDQRVFALIGPVLLPSALFRVFLAGLSGFCLLCLCISALPALQMVRRRRRRLLRSLTLLLLLLLLASALTLLLTARISAPLTLGPLLVTNGTIWTMLTGFTTLVTLYVFSLLLTMTTLPVALVEGLTLLLAPLRRLRLPVDDFALMALLALRFVPTLFDEAEQLMKAQSARGADMAHGSFRERLQSLLTFFAPLMHATLRRASDLAVALDARGYRSEGPRTVLHERSFAFNDLFAMSTVVLITLATLFL